MEQQKLKEVTDRSIYMIESRDRLGLLKCLESNSKILLKDLVDHRGYTLLHLACFKNLDDIAVTLIQVAKRTLAPQVIKDWINFKTDDDGFTALHFASFRGNLKLIELLLSNGADMYMKNNYGINMLHVAA